MSSPPDFLGMALGFINQQKQRRANAREQAQQNQAMQLDQQRFEMQAESQREQTRQQGLAQASTALKESEGDFNYAKSILEATTHGDYPSSYLEILKGGAKLIKKQIETAKATPTESGQADLVGGAAAAAAAQRDPAAAQMSLLRAMPNLPPSEAALSNQLAMRAGGALAENQRQRSEFEGRTRFGTEENLRQARGTAAIGDARDSGNYLVPAATAASMGLKGVPGPNGLLVVPARNRAEQNRIMAAGGIQTGAASGVGLAGEGLNVPTATQGKMFERLEAIGEQRRTMQRIGEGYDPKYTEFLGQAEAGLNKFATKLGIRTSDERKEFAAGYNSFKADLGNNLMAKIQERAATTFTDRLYDRMRKWNLTEDLSDPEFRRLYKEISTELDLNLARTIYSLKHDPLAAAEAEQSGELSMKTRNSLENRYTDGRLNRMMRTTEQRAVAGAVRSGASDEEALRAGQEAVEREYYTPEPGAQ